MKLVFIFFSLQLVFQSAARQMLKESEHNNKLRLLTLIVNDRGAKVNTEVAGRERERERERERRKKREGERD